VGKVNCCDTRKLTPIVIPIVLAILIAIGILWALKPGNYPVTTRVTFTPSSTSDPVAQPDGSWCARNIPTACVRPDGSIHIPRGSTPDTLIAFFAIRKKMPNVESLALWDYASYGPEYETQEVSGVLSADDALKALLKGSGLTIRYSIERRWSNPDSGSVSPLPAVSGR
jgi:hypothetical protein